MATITDFRVPVEQFALADTFSRVPDLYVEIERFAAQESDSAIPFVWVRAEDFDAFEAALGTDPSVDRYTVLAEFEDERFYRMNWVDEVELVVHLLLEEEGVITQAHANDGTWHLQVMFPDHDSLSGTYEFCEDRGLDLTVDSIYSLDNEGESQFGLTDSQYRTLSAAKDRGYYEVPRETTMSELADSLDISHQALSERLRRAHGSLVDRALSTSNAKKQPGQPLEESH
ncbi:helix-turn-helix domain-containing protein [Halalkalicoccus jeotgali]|uniref:DNA binding domain-containing protein n=1 Tax=Halalkalicoccus jeotgali (strain DSM 18796 / CECT 7217 / JCM 14584 / KCTC 4019 / B3) TaxID=795797 RepID=D8J804_HALJB|nr:helix-turn-helix domain-containing protein [Halalkalicoccus jeotgali]ADJ14117.1 DNA binding domain-containing protein [Halalkalicoccus jeotgali B3]ELY34701.1 DNA binding domain-containing protein [Halalkalicoccus jeotgali B3]